MTIDINVEPLELLEILVEKERLRQQVVMLEREAGKRTTEQEVDGTGRNRRSSDTSAVFR